MASASSSSNNDNHIYECKVQFYKEVSSNSNTSSNNPLFSAARYEETIDLVVNAKLKTPGCRIAQEIHCLKTYDVTDFGGKLKLTKKDDDEFSDGLIKYFVQIDEIYDTIKEAVNGILFGYYSFNQIFKASGSATSHVEDVPDEGPKTLREIARLQSLTGGKGMLKCDCKGGCKTNRCKCTQAKVLCNSRCHHSGTCDNK